MATTGPTKNMTAADFLAHELRLLKDKPEQYAALKVATKVVATFTDLGDLRAAFDQVSGSKMGFLTDHLRRLSAREDEINDLKKSAYPTLSIGLAAIAREYETRLISERRREISPLIGEAERAFKVFKPDDMMSNSEAFAAEQDFATRRTPK